MAERCSRIDTRSATAYINDEKHRHWRAEQLHHLKPLELRSRFPTGY